MTKFVLDIGIAITDAMVGVSNFINDIGMSIPVAIGMFTGLVQVIKSLGTGNKIGGLLNVSRFLTGKLVPSANSARESVQSVSTELNNVNSASNNANRAINSTANATQNLGRNTTRATAQINTAKVSMKNLDSSSRAVKEGVTATGKSFKVYSRSAEQLERNTERLRTNQVQLNREVTTSHRVVSTANQSSKSWISNLLSVNAKTALTTVATGLLNGALLSLAGAGITAVIKGLQNWANANKNAREEITSNIEATQSEIASNKNKMSVLQDTGKKYEELAKKTNKSAKEMEEMKEHANKLAEVLPELKIGQDADGNAIIAMAGDVEYLIARLENANKVKMQLLEGQQSEKADASMKLLSEGDNIGKSALEKRAQVQKDYDVKMSQMEQQRIDIMRKIRMAEGKDVQKYNKQLLELNAERDKFTTEYNSKYIEENQKVQELANDIRQHSVNTLRNSSEFKSLTDEAKQSVQDFVGLLDFSEVNEDNIGKVNLALKQISKSVADGSIDMESYKQRVMAINTEFGLSGNIEKYNSEMSNLAREMSATSGADFESVLNMLKSMDDASLKAESGLNKFLSAYSKTIGDVANGDKVAQALQGQFDAISNALNELSNMSPDDIELNQKIGLNLISDENIPKQVQDMVRELMFDKNLDSQDVLKVTQKVLIDLQNDGKIDDNELKDIQKMIDEKFGEGTYTFKADMDVTPKVKTEMVEQAIETLKTKYGELPEEVETLIRTGGVATSEADANKIKYMYDSFPEEVRTLVETYGEEEASNRIIELMNWYNLLPEEVKTELRAEGYDTEEIAYISQLYKAFPEEVVTQILADGSQAIKDAESYGEIIDGLPTILKTDIDLDDSLFQAKKGGITGFIQDMLGKEETVIKADMDISQVEQKEKQIGNIEDKSVVVKVEAEDSGLNKVVQTSVERVNSIKQTKKPDIDANGKPLKKTVKDTEKDVNKIKQKDPVKILANSSNAMGKISNVKTGLSGLKDKNVQVTVTTKYKTIGSPTSHSKGTGISGISAYPTEPVASEMIRREVPVDNTLNGEISSRMPSVFAQSRATSWTPIDTSKYSVLDSVKYSIELLKELSNRISMVSNQVGILDEKMKDAVGNEKIKFLQQQNALYKEQMQLQRELQQKLTTQQSWIKNELAWKGFSFTSDGNLRNYEEKLRAMEKEAERLKNIADNASKKSSSYTGKDEKYKKRLENESNSAKDKADKYNDSLSETKKLLQEYLSITFTDLPNAQKEWESLNNKVQENNDLLEELNRRQRTYTYDNKLKELNREYQILADKLAVINEQMEIYSGQNKINALKEQIKLLEQQRLKQEELSRQYNNMMWSYKQDMGKYGFKFDSEHNVSNIDEVLNKYENSEDLEKVNKLLEEYYKLQDGMNGTKKDWHELNNEIEKSQEALEKLNREQKLYTHKNKVQEIEHQYDSLSDKLALLDEQIKNAYGGEKLDLIDKQIKLLEEQAKKQQELIKSYSAMAKVYKDDLSFYGFKFTEEGDIENLDEILNKYQDSKYIERIKNLVEEYIKIQRDDLPDATLEWEKLQSQIKDAYKEQLSITKEVEEKITEVYKKQVEERKKLIDKELEARLDAIDKEKQAYNDARAEADYNKDKTKQEETIAELQRQLDIAMRDTSQKGQKKVQDLLKQLAEEQEKLSDMVQDKMDEQINDMFDKESERLENEADKKKEELDEKYSDENLKEIVQDVIKSGVFVGLDGELKDLQDTLLDFEDKFGDGMSAMGDIIKSELVTNLQIAQNAMKDLKKIMEELDLKKYSSEISLTSNSRVMPSATGRSVSPVINFNSELIRVEGNVDKDTLPQLEDMIERAKTEIVNEIFENIR